MDDVSGPIVACAETVSFVTPEASSPLPIFRTQYDQKELHVHLVQGSTPLTSFEFPFRRAALDRGNLTARVVA